MAARVPAITLTGPHNSTSPPSPAQSPIKGTQDATSLRRPGSRSSLGRPDTAHSNWPSPGNPIRRLSDLVAPAGNGPGADDSHVSSKHDARAAMDPLSQHIMNRISTPSTSPAGARPTTSDSSAHKEDRSDKDSAAAPVLRNHWAPSRTDGTNEGAQKELKKSVKAVSFLGRLIGAKKRTADEHAIEDDSVSAGDRPEGNDATVFAQPVDYVGYSPRHLQPPAYIKVRSKNTKQRDFDRLFLAQELNCRKRRRAEKPNGSNKLHRKSSATPDANTVWAMEFSKDGKHLAAAGVDTVVRIWAALSSSGDRQRHEKQESTESEANGSGAHAEHLSAPVFESRPVREFEGHTATVLDLSWSKNNFLLSSSMDKTVRLWHVSRAECLCTFKHGDFVPSISFHPKDDRFFLAGSLDSRLRLWSIPDKSVAYSAKLPDMITAVAFTPDGKSCIAGCLSGLCMFYETEGLKYQAQIHVRSTRGQNAKGSKITGIQSHHSRSGETKLLITSNDSRIRLYNYRDKSLELKFKGNENNSSQIRATLSDCGRYVVCGSEDRNAYIWSLGPTADGDKRPVEMFEAHNTMTTAVCVAPSKTRQLLSRSEDPVYDICNPPPVTLMSRNEHAESHTSSRPPTENGSIQATPNDVDATFSRAQPSPAFLTRSKHDEGNIIVTADFMGNIKVFRQDCAWSKRKTDDWDRTSIFTKRSGKAGSLATKASQRSLRGERPGTAMARQAQASSDRILDWRREIAGGSMTNGSLQRNPSSGTSRSGSPRKTGRDRNGSIKSAHPLSGHAMADADGIGRQDHQPTNDNPIPPDSSASKQSLSSHDENPLLIQGGQSYAYWNTDAWKAQAVKMHKLHDEHTHPPPLSTIRSREEPATPSSVKDGEEVHFASRPKTSTGKSYVSRLSDEMSSDSEGFEDAREEGEDGVT